MRYRQVMGPKKEILRFTGKGSGGSGRSGFRFTVSGPWSLLEG